MKDSFVFYKSWIKAIRRLESSDSQMKVINAICDFTFNDTNFNDNDNLNANVNSNATDNVNSNATEKEKVNNNDKDLKLLFTPPTLKEVQNFCMNQNLKTDPVEFWTYYNIRKWARIKNWQSQVMWWESRRFEKATDYNSTDAIPSV